MSQRTIPTVTKLTGETSDQLWEFGHAQRISIPDPTAPKHFPCHIIGSANGLIVSHGTDFVGIPWSVLRPMWEQANPKLVAPPAPAIKEVKPHIKAALEGASKLPQP